MAQILEIAQWGHSILSQTANPIVEVSQKEIQTLIHSLIATTHQANGVGIAAPQVFQSHRLFIMASRPTPRYPHAPVMEPTAVINPRILDCSTESVKDWEGCLSVTGWRGLVPRYQAIAVEYTDQWGNLRQQELTGFVARIFQHELDHLNGLVFLDRLDDPQDLYTEEVYQKILKNSQVGEKS
ncbi:MAG: peptide deformylase [Snowella sp.]|nr:peptide deformylase [Snowella sp.]